MQGPHRLLIAVGCLLLALIPAFGCQTHVPSILLEVQDPSGLAPTQLLVTISVDGLEARRVTRPEAPNGPLESPQTLRLFLPDESIGQQVDLAVEALRDGKVVGTAQSVIVVNERVDTSVKLSLIEVPYVCDETTCANGCCAEGECIEDAFEACGLGGGACGACNRIAADQCVDGACQCGEGTPCPAGFACEAGGCIPMGEGESCMSAESCKSPPGQCYEEQGTCGEDGKCSYAPKGTTAACDDGIRCTVNDVCDGAGTCGGAAKVCDAPPNSSCWDRAGSCDEATGACVYPQKPVATACGVNTDCVQSSCNAEGACVSFDALDGSECGAPACGICISGTCEIQCLATLCCGNGVCRSPKGTCEIEP